jgi:dTDP-4-dehydrorhamnose 3,5-epimerase/CDP-3, 6-dideoxy-D-glycero-D-glycero-4-hexulose-5-epimerase
LDVVLDIRKNSPTYGQYVSAELSAENNTAIYIPKGFAHGFKTLTDHATTFYFVSSENHRGSDDGILFSSIGLDWNVSNPIVSDRDYSFKPFSEFISPF